MAPANPNPLRTIPARLQQQLQFLLEIDRLKQVLRRTYLLHEARRENSAEHSWQVALMANLLAEHADFPVEVARVTRMLLIHDLVEIDVGDTYIYDAAGQAERPGRERRAAERLFGLLPPDQAAEFRALWEEFEACVTPDARFAGALDRLMPMLLNYHKEGQSWREHKIHAGQVLQLNCKIGNASQALWEHAQQLVADATAKGWLRKGNPEEASHGPVATGNFP